MNSLKIGTCYRKWMLILLALCGFTNIWAVDEPSYILAEDSSNYIIASLLIISPTNEVYSVFGHCAFRMECPTHSLDYVFTYESDTSIGGFVTFFAGKAEAAFVAVPTEEFKAVIQRQQRGIQQYELNLSHHQKQELWRNLDIDMVEGAHRKFNLLLSNCVSTTVEKIKESSIGDHLEWAPWEGSMLLNNGDLVRHNARRSPWAEFLFVSFLGTGYNDYYDQETRLCPEILIDVLSKASLVDQQTGSRRPVLTGRQQVLLPESRVLSDMVVTPAALFGVLLLIVVFLTFAEWKWHWLRPARWLDVTLFIAQSLLGISLLYITCVSEIFGMLWNWYLIPFNPLPLLLWLILRKHKQYGRVYLLYTAILVIMIALTPFIAQLDWTHQLITCMLAIRCGSHAMRYLMKKDNFQPTNKK